MYSLLSFWLTILSIEVFSPLSFLFFFFNRATIRGHERKPWQHFLSVCSNDTLVLCSKQLWIFRIREQNLIEFPHFFCCCCLVLFKGWSTALSLTLKRRREASGKGEQGGLGPLESEQHKHTTCTCSSAVCALLDLIIKTSFPPGKCCWEKRRNNQRWVWCWRIFQFCMHSQSKKYQI